MKAMTQAMHRNAGLLLLAAIVGATVFAQDTHYAPAGEQIPPPDCLTLKNAYQTALAGGFAGCPPLTHE
jgi:hypothetical protein